MELDKGRRDALAYILMAYMQTINFYGSAWDSAMDSLHTRSRLEVANEVLGALGVETEMVVNECNGKYQYLVIDGWMYEL